MQLVDLLILGLSTYGAVYLITQTSGPFAIFSRLRELGLFRKVLSCFYCAAPWTAAVILAAYQFEQLRFILVILAMVGTAYFLFRRGNGN